MALSLVKVSVVAALATALLIPQIASPEGAEPKLRGFHKNVTGQESSRGPGIVPRGEEETSTIVNGQPGDETKQKMGIIVVEKPGDETKQKMGIIVVEKPGDEAKQKMGIIVVEKPGDEAKQKMEIIPQEKPRR